MLSLPKTWKSMVAGSALLLAVGCGGNIGDSNVGSQYGAAKSDEWDYTKGLFPVNLSSLQQIAIGYEYRNPVVKSEYVAWVGTYPGENCALPKVNSDSKSFLDKWNLREGPDGYQGDCPSLADIAELQAHRPTKEWYDAQQNKKSEAREYFEGVWPWWLDPVKCYPEAMPADSQNHFMNTLVWFTTTPSISLYGSFVEDWRSYECNLGSDKRPEQRFVQYFLAQKEEYRSPINYGGYRSYYDVLSDANDAMTREPKITARGCGMGDSGEWCMKDCVKQGQNLTLKGFAYETRMCAPVYNTMYMGEASNTVNFLCDKKKWNMQNKEEYDPYDKGPGSRIRELVKGSGKAECSGMIPPSFDGVDENGHPETAVPVIMFIAAIEKGNPGDEGKAGVVFEFNKVASNADFTFHYDVEHVMGYIVRNGWGTPYGSYLMYNPKTGETFLGNPDKMGDDRVITNFEGKNEVVRGPMYVGATIVPRFSGYGAYVALGSFLGETDRSWAMSNSEFPSYFTGIYTADGYVDILDQEVFIPKPFM